MSAGQGDRIHRVIGEVDGDEANLVLVLHEVLRQEREDGWQEGYADAMRGQYEADRLAEKREQQAAAAAAQEGSQ